MPAPVVDYKPIANGVGAYVESQAQYEIDLAPGGVLVNGFPAGLVTKERYNKVIRQSSVVAAALANTIANVDGLDVLDDGDVAALATRLANALSVLAAAGSWTTGDVKLTMKTSADAGWLMFDDSTMGDAASGATHASAANQALFTLLWNNINDTWAPVVGGRGVSAAADWAAHKKLTLPKMLGRALAISGAGSGLTSRALGQNLGEETHVLSNAEMPSHAHGVNDPGHAHGVNDPGHAHGLLGFNDTTNNGYVTLTGSSQTWGGATEIAGTGISIQSAGTGISIQNNGGGGAHNTMQPTTFLNAMIKL